MANIPKSVANELVAGVNEGADLLTGTMRTVVPRGKDGRNELAESIRKEPGRRPLQVLVKAGGELTTRRMGGTTYDYSMGQEFGNEKVPAQPFFWPSYRLTKKRIRSTISRRMKKGIEKVVTLK